MKILFTAISAAALLSLAPCRGDDTAPAMAENSHGSYNVAAQKPSVGLFGPNSYAKREVQYEKDHPGTKKYFIVRSVPVSDGHGNMHMVPRKTFYKSQEDAEAAAAAQ